MSNASYTFLRYLDDSYRVTWQTFDDWLRAREGVYLIVGPPGTGKTHYGAELCFAKRTKVEGVELVSDHGECIAVYFNVSMKLDAASRNPFGYVKTLDGVVQSALAKNSEYRLYLYPKRDKSGEIVGWIQPPESIELLRARFAQAYGITYSLDPYTPAEGNEVFHVFDYAINVFPFMSLSEILKTIERDLVDIHRKAPYVVADYVAYLLKSRRVDFTLGRRIVWKRKYTYVHCVGKGRKRRCFVPDAVFLDEFQDLSPLLLAAVTVMFPNIRVAIVAGDEDQAVYHSLQGADPRFMINVAKGLEAGRYKGPPPIVLSQSKRVAEPVAAFARKVISRIKDRIPKEWRGRDVEASVRRVTPREALDLIRRLAEVYEPELTKLAPSGTIDQRKLEHNSIMILAPTNSEVYEWFLAVLALGFVPGSLKVNIAPAIELALKSLIEGKELPQNTPMARALQMFVKAVESRGHNPREYVKQVLRMAEVGISPIYVDTAYAAKGLQRQVVFVVNYTKHARAVGEIRPFYVAVTRSFTNVYIIDKPDDSYYTWVRVDI
jgi:hypothetical protein